MMYYSNTTASNHGFPIRNQTVTYSVERSNSLAGTLEAVLKELKALQESSQGRIRLQYAVLDEKRYFDIIAFHKDFDDEVVYHLYGYLPQIQNHFSAFDWEVRLIPVAESDTFVPIHEIKSV